jgi:predicted O-methyltransferase YrrM
MWCKRGYFNEDQRDYFIELLKKINPNCVLETGFCTGRSTYTVLNNSENIEKMISIDINFDYMKPEGRQMRELLTTNYKQLQTIEGSSQKSLTSDFINNQFPDGIDWFTVDGDHSYSGCLFDLETVLPYMNKGGIIIIDDYKSGPPNGCNIPDVTRACDDFSHKHPDLIKNEWNCEGKGFCIFYI